MPDKDINQFFSLHLVPNICHDNMQYMKYVMNVFRDRI